MKKILLIVFLILLPLIVFFVILIVTIGAEVGETIIEEQVNNMRANSSVINNQLYAERYRALLNKYLLTKGYVSLERMVFYLQRTNNILDTSTLSMEKWNQAYLDNADSEEKQMIPIKTICKKLNDDLTLSEFTIESGRNGKGVQIDVINLCDDNGVDVATSDQYYETYLPLPYTFPLKTNFSITSIVFEYRDVDFGVTYEQQDRTNYHSGWDFAVPIGTNFYSICDGEISNIINTQDNDLPYKQSLNDIGNYITITCDNNLIATYRHIQYRSQPEYLQIGSNVKKGDLIGRTSTTGTSTGGHLHLELKDSNGNLLDAMAYIDFTNYEGN